MYLTDSIMLMVWLSLSVAASPSSQFPQEIFRQHGKPGAEARKQEG
jgi:hypothetical protein